MYARGSLCLLLIIILSSGRTHKHTHTRHRAAYLSYCSSDISVIAPLIHLGRIFLCAMETKPNPSAVKKLTWISSLHRSNRTRAERFPFPFAFVTTFRAGQGGGESVHGHTGPGGLSPPRPDCVCGRARVIFGLFKHDDAINAAPKGF